MITITEQHCERCGHDWLPRIPQPVMCPACKSRIWDKPKDLNVSHALHAPVDR